MAPAKIAYTSATTHDLSTWLIDWDTHLRAANVAASTITSYLACGRSLHAYLRGAGRSTRIADVDARAIEAFLADLFTRPGRGGRLMSAANVAKHYRSLQQLFRWLAEEDEIATDPMCKMRPPKVPKATVPIMTTEQVSALLAAAAAKPPHQATPVAAARAEFERRRNMAILRCFLDTGARLDEVSGLTAAGVDPRGREVPGSIDWKMGVLHVMGKGRKPRAAPFGPKCSEALRRYVRARANHPHAASPSLWLGERGPLTSEGIHRMLARIARRANLGINVHAHLFRHHFAHQWLLGGGSESDLMRLLGWSSHDMVRYYAETTADERAITAYHRTLVTNHL
jgi:site-specific recombinase XerD